MRGDFTIDGESAFSTFGVFIQKGGYADVIALPRFKRMEEVDWLDEDGLDIDLSAPVLDAKQVNIQLGFTDIDQLSNFYEYLSLDHSHTFVFSEISRSASLRLVSSGSINSLIKAGVVTLSFIDDNFTFTSATPAALGASRVRQRGFKLDGIDFSRFGCWVLDGTLQSLRQTPQIKQNLIVSSNRAAGQTYLGQDEVKYASKDLTMQMLINARNISEFNRFTGALYSTLIQSGERTLALGDWADSLSCCYKSISIKRFAICRSGTIWLEFSLVFTLIGYRPFDED